MNDLFQGTEAFSAEDVLPDAPLAERLRPRALSDVVGQEHVLGEKGFITRCVAAGQPASIIFWGPPGCGKTTLAKLYAQAFGAHFMMLSGVTAGVADLKKEAEAARERLKAAHPQRTVLFMDEIHRLNRAQQDAFLPFVENGTLILVGATTENPSFRLNGALLSRARVLTLKALDESALAQVLERAEAYLGYTLPLTEEGRAFLLQSASGDARYLLGLVETLDVTRTALSDEGTAEEDLPVWDVPELGELLQKRFALYDQAGEEHYNLISALHKSVRGSDPDAALYWFSRMVQGGEDVLFIARRVIRMAVEDIGLADPQALTQAIAAKEAYEMLGSPEGELAVAQAIVYVALSPKSNAVYTAYKASVAAAEKTSHLGPPMVIRNAPTKLMKGLGYGEGYIYDHDTPEAFSGQNYFPEGMKRPAFYAPVDRGFERDMKKRTEYFAALRKKLGRG